MSKEKNDLSLRIFSILIAVTLWTYVMSEVNPEQPQTHKNITVAFNNMEVLERQGLQLMEPNETMVTVKVVGTKSDFAKSKFSSKNIKAQVDLSGYTEGQKRVPINVTLDQSSNIRVVSYEPSDILFTFDKIITKEKTVIIKTEGNLPTDYILGDITKKVDSVLLTGPRSWVNGVSEIIGTVKIGDRTDDLDITVPIQLLDDNGNNVQGVKYEPGAIDVSIPIFKKKNLPIELNLATEPPENYEITNIKISPESIAIKGKKNIDNLVSIQTKPLEIDYLSENIDLPIELELPEGITLLNPNEKITVTIEVEETATKTFEYRIEEIEKRFLDENLILAEEDNHKIISVLVKGNKEIIEDLTDEDLKAYLEFNMMEEGINRIYIGFNPPEGIIIEEVSPQPIELRLIKE